jgi:hypothetical protein
MGVREVDPHFSPVRIWDRGSLAGGVVNVGYSEVTCEKALRGEPYLKFLSGGASVITGDRQFVARVLGFLLVKIGRR